MRPLLLVFWGLLVVVVDVTIAGYDVVADVVGWILVAYGSLRLRGREPVFLAAVAGAVVGGVGAVWRLVPALTGPVVQDLPGVVEIVASTAVVVATCTGIDRLLAHEASIARQARVIRALDVVLTVVALVGYLGIMEMSPTWMLRGGLIVLPLLVAALVGFVWFLVLLWRVRNRPDLGGAT